jgi:hypothetical protein
MYTCNVCGGIIEELGEMAVTNGGCVCAQKKAEESANSLQQLKAEIAAMFPQWKHCCELGVEWYEVDISHVERLRQLSAI